MIGRRTLKMMSIFSLASLPMNAGQQYLGVLAEMAIVTGVYRPVRWQSEVSTVAEMLVSLPARLHFLEESHS